MSPHVIELCFYSVSSIMFGFIALYPNRWMDLFNKRALLETTPKMMGVFRPFAAVVCVTSLGMVVVDLWRLAR